MSEYYKAKRARNLFDPLSKQPFRLSRSKLDLFLNCQRCFYLDRRLGIGRPPGFPFNLNSAVDALLKTEFDLHRAKGSKHPLCDRYGVDAIPYRDERMDEWRDSLRRGCKYLHIETNLLITGGVDDIWVRPNGELIIVDYKATSRNGEISLEADWQIGYKRQIEIYQWLFRRNGFKVSQISYFVYCNGRSNRPTFDGRLEFDIKLLPYLGDDSWVEQAVYDAKACLVSSEVPAAAKQCDYCAYKWAIDDLKLITR